MTDFVAQLINNTVEVKIAGGDVLWPLVVRAEAGADEAEAALGLAQTALEETVEARNEVLAVFEGLVEGALWARNYDEGDGDGNMWRRALAASQALGGKKIKAAPGVYVMDGTTTLSQGLFGIEGAGTVNIECDDGMISFVGPTAAGTGTIQTSTTSRTVTGTGTTFTSLVAGQALYTGLGVFVGVVAIKPTSNISLTLTEPAKVTISPTGAWRRGSGAGSLLSMSGGAKLKVNNVEFDGTNMVGNFAAKFENAGPVSGGVVKFKGKTARWLGNIGEFDLDVLESHDAFGHGISFGGGTRPPGRIGRITVRNSTKSGFNPSGMIGTSQLLVDEMDVRWTKFETHGIQYPSQYAGLRSGNGTNELTVRKMYVEGYYRALRITDGDHVWVEWLDFKNLLANAVLINSKDQISRAVGVGLVTGVNPSRANGLAAISDVDGTEAFDGPSDVIAIAAGAGATVGRMAVEADTYLRGLGTITVTAGSTTVICRDYAQQGKDYNCFKAVNDGDFLFDNSERVLGRAIGRTDGILTGTSTATHGSDQLVGDGTLYLTEVAVGDLVIGSNGSHVCRVESIEDDEHLTMADAYAGVDGANLAADIMEYTTRRYWTDAGETTPAGLRPAQSKSSEITDWLATVHHASQSLSLRHGSLQTVTAGLYYQRTVDPYFFAPGIGKITVGTGADAISGNGDARFLSQFAAGDALFNLNGDLVREVATITDDDTATLTGNALVAITDGDFLIGRWKKVPVGLRIYPEATDTNINPDDCYVRGAVVQHVINGPSLRSRPPASVILSQLADIKPAIGDRRFVTNLVPPGEMVWNGSLWKRAAEEGLTSTAEAGSFSVAYGVFASSIRLTATNSADRTLTILTATMPEGAEFEFNTSTGATANTIIVDDASPPNTLYILRPGHSGRVKMSSGNVRRAGISPVVIQAPREVVGIGSPEGVVFGANGDRFVQTDGAAGSQLWIKASSPTGTTGWVTIGSQPAPTYGTNAAVVAATISGSVLSLRTDGGTSPGDGGDALWKRVDTEPGHDGKLQSADGAWWELASFRIVPEMLGAASHPTAGAAKAAASQSAALQTVVEVAAALNRPVELRGFYGISAALVVAAGQMIVGAGDVAASGLTTVTSGDGAHHAIYGDQAHGLRLSGFTILHKQAASGQWDGVRVERSVDAQISIHSFDARVCCVRFVDCEDSTVRDGRFGASTEALYPADRPFAAVYLDSCSNSHAIDSVGERLSFGFNITGDETWSKSYFTADSTANTLAVEANCWDNVSTGDTAIMRVRNEGILPGGLDDTTTYWIIKTATSPLLQLATTFANAMAGTAIDLTSAGVTGRRRTQITRTLRYTACAINAATDEITVDPTWWSMVETQSKCVFAQGAFGANNAPGGGVYPAPTTYATTYYIIKSVTPNVIKLATSAANALAGTAINLTTAPTGAYLAIGDQSVYSSNDHLGTKPITDTANCSFQNDVIRRYRGHAFNISTGRGCWGDKCLAEGHDEFVGGIRSVRAAFQVKHAYGDGSDYNGYTRCGAVDASIGFQSQEGNHNLFDDCSVDGVEYDAVFANSAPNTIVRNMRVTGLKGNFFRANNASNCQIDGYDVEAAATGANALMVMKNSGACVIGAGRHAGTFAACLMIDTSSGSFDILPGVKTRGLPNFIVPTTGNYPRSVGREVSLTALGVAALCAVAGGVHVARWRTLTTVAASGSTPARYRMGRVGSTASMVSARAPTAAALGVTTHTGASGATINTATDEITVASGFYDQLATGTNVMLAVMSGAMPAPLAVNTTYYVILVGSNKIKLATSSANATAGTAIDLTTAGDDDCMISFPTWILNSGGLATEISVVDGTSGSLFVEVAMIPQ